MQNARPERRFFQLHLSTVLVLMLLSAGLLGANLLPQVYQLGNLNWEYQGWPWALKVDLDYDNPGFFDVFTLRRGWIAERSVEDYWYVRLGGNIAVALGILTLAGVLLEWRLRRRDKYKEAVHG